MQNKDPKTILVGSAAIAADDSLSTDVPTPVVNYGISENPSMSRVPIMVHQEAQSSVSLAADSQQPLPEQPGSRRRLPIRKAVVVSALVSLVVTAITGLTLVKLARHAVPDSWAKPKIETQDLSLENAGLANLPDELQGSKPSLLVNGDVVVRGDIKISNGNFITVIQAADANANQIFTLPAGSGTICLDTNNCSFVTNAQLQTELGQLGGQAIPASSLVNNQQGAVSIQGTLNQISVSTNNGVIQISTPQDIALGSSPTFAGLTLSNLDCSSNANGGALTANAGVISCSDDDGGAGSPLSGSGANGQVAYFNGGTNLTSSANFLFDGTDLTLNNASSELRIAESVGGVFYGIIDIGDLSSDQTYTLPDASGTICLTSGNCVGVGGTGDVLNNGQNGPLTVGTNNATSLVLETANTARLTISSAGAVTVGGSVTAASFSGDGSALTALNGSNISSGTVANNRLTNSGALTVTAGNGLSGGGSVALGSSTSLSVAYGSAANTAVQGNVQLTCPSGSGNLSGGGTVITLGSGGTCGAIAISATPSFTSVTATSFIGSLTGNASTATALAADPSGCAANQFALAIAANGNLTCAALTDGDVPNTLTIGAASTVADGALSVNVSLLGQTIDGSEIVNGSVANVDLANSSLTVTVGNGLSGGGSVSLGGSTSLSVAYGSSANTAVQGNVTLTCPSGTGNLSGGGTVITLGAGGTCGGIAISTTPSFTTVTATTFVGSLTGNASTATALAADPSGCAANQFANGIAANGNLSCAGIVDADVSDTLTASIFKGSGSTTDAIDLASAEVAGILADGNVSDTLTIGAASTVADGALSVNVSLLGQTIDGTEIVNGSVANADLTNSSLTVTAGNGLSGGGSVALGSSTILSVAYGSSANTAVQGNVSITCPTVSGNLTGGGGSITLGTGGSCSAIGFTATPSFTTTTTTNLVVNSESFNDLTGNGLQNATNVLEVLAVANKGITVGASGVALINCSTNQILKYNGSNQWACAADNDTGGSGVASLNSLTGALTIQGTANEITVSDNGSNTITVGLPDDVTIGSDLVVTDTLNVNGANVGLSVANSAEITGTLALGNSADALNPGQFYEPGSTNSVSLEIAQTVTDIASFDGVFGSSIALLLDPVASSSGIAMGSMTAVGTEALNANDYGIIIGSGSGVGHKGSGTVDNMQAILGSVQNVGTGTVSYAYGANLQVSNAVGATLGQGTGLYAIVSNEGTAQSLAGGVQGSVNAAGATVESIFGSVIIANNEGDVTLDTNGRSLAGIDLSVLNSGTIGSGGVVQGNAIKVTNSGVVASGSGEVIGDDITVINSGAGEANILAGSKVVVTQGSSVDLGNLIGYHATINNTGSSTVNLGAAYVVGPATNTGGGSILSNYGMFIWGQTGGTILNTGIAIGETSGAITNVNLLLGSSVGSTGSSWSIFNGSTNANLFAGQLIFSGVSTDIVAANEENLTLVAGSSGLGVGANLELMGGGGFTLGGDVNITSGTALGDSGDINLVTPDGGIGGGGGDINLTTGGGITGAGGDINLTTSGGTGGAGAINLTAASTANGGAINLTAGNGASNAGGNVTLQAGTGTLSGGSINIIAGTGASNGMVNVTGNLLPATNDIYDLGSNALRWRDLYLGGETLHLGTSITDEATFGYDTTRNVLKIGTTEPQSTLEVIGNVVSAGTQWTSRTSAADNSWQSITYGNGLFVAVSSSGTGNRVMTSPDGINWTTRSTTGLDNAWQSVTYGNGLFVAVASNSVMTSPDGVTWTSRTSAANNVWTSVTYGNGLFVAVSDTGTSNRVMTSPDGITWTTRSTTGLDNVWRSVTYGNGRFVAVACGVTASSTCNFTAGNRVMTSPDGITWTTQADAADHEWTSVTYGNGMFVAVSQASLSGGFDRIMTSPDAVTWTIRQAGGSSSYTSVTYGNGLFVTVTSAGTGTRAATSVDGVTWTTRTSAANNGWQAVTYGNGMFVAVSVSGSGNRVMTSGIQHSQVTPGNNIYQGGMDIRSGDVSVTTSSTTAFLVQNAAGTDLINADTTNMIVRPGTVASYTTQSLTTTQVVSANNQGTPFNSIVIGTDGLPIIAYNDETTNDLVVAKCTVADCSTRTTTNITSVANDGEYPDIAIGSDGLPVILHYNVTATDPSVTHCNDIACTSSTTTVIADVDGAGTNGSIAIGRDGLPILAYRNFTDTDVTITKCANATCTSITATTQLVNADNVGFSVSMKIGSDGLPVMAYDNSTDTDVMVTKCTNQSCTSQTTTQLTTTNTDNNWTSLAIGSNGMPVIVSNDLTASSGIALVTCSNLDCTALQRNFIDASQTFTGSLSLGINSEGLPIIAAFAYNGANSDLDIISCDDAVCTNPTITAFNDADNSGLYTDLAFGTDGFPIAIHQNLTDTDLMIVKCVDSTCSAASGSVLGGGATLGSVAGAWRSIYFDTLNLGDEDAHVVLDALGNFRANSLLAGSDGTVSTSGHLAVGNSSNANNTGELIYPGDDYYSVLSIEENVTATDGYINGITNFLNLDPTGIFLGQVYATDSEVTTDASNIQNFGVVASGYFRSAHAGSGDVATAIGLQASVQNMGSGDITDAMGVRTRVRNLGAGLIGSSYGLYVDTASNSGGGTMLTNVGVYIADQTGIASTYNYNLHSAGASSINMFEGAIKLQGDILQASNGVNALGDSESMLPNAGFEVNSDSTTTVADNWTFAQTVATATPSVSSTSPGQGDRSQQIVTSSAAAEATLTSACIPTSISQTYSLSLRYKGSAAVLLAYDSYLDTYTSKANCVSQTTPTTVNGTVNGTMPTAWTPITTNHAIAATATWARVRFKVGSASAAATYNIDGVRLTPSALNTGVDLAENFPTASGEALVPGELVRFGSPATNGEAAAVRSSGAYDSNLFGVVSTYPGLTLDDGQGYEKVTVALAGRVPALVNDENGLISIGDPITASSVPGVGMKASGAGQIIGYAMTATTASGQSTIVVKLAPGFWTPTLSGVLQSQAANFGSLQTSGLANLASLNVSGATTLTSLTVNGNATIGGTLTVSGDVHVANLYVNGHLVNKGPKPQIVPGSAIGAVLGITTEVDGTDSVGSITVTVGSHMPSSGNLAEITFANPFSNPPKIILSGNNKKSVKLAAYIVKTNIGFKIVSDDPLEVNTTYSFDYVVIGAEN